GIPHREELQLNEETLYAGGPYRNDNEKALEALPQIRQWIFDGKTREADKLINQTFFTQTHGMPFKTAGSVLINFKGLEDYQNYSRDLGDEKAFVLSLCMVDGRTHT